MRLVLDTSVLIDHFRGRPVAATTLIADALERGDVEFIRGPSRGARRHAGRRRVRDTVCVAYQGKLGLSRIFSLKVNRRTLSDFDLKYFDAGK